MRVVDEAPEKSKVAAFVITGDGRTEKKVLSALAEIYNGNQKVLLFPKSSLSKKTGLDALAAIDDVFRITGYTKFLVLLDREHFNEWAFRRKLSELFGEYHTEGKNPYKIVAGELEIHMVVFGKIASIEEHIAELINLEAGTERITMDGATVQVLKSQIKTFLKSAGHKKLTKFIKASSIENIERAFGPLVAAIKMLERM